MKNCYRIVFLSFLMVMPQVWAENCNWDAAMWYVDTWGKGPCDNQFPAGFLFPDSLTALQACEKEQEAIAQRPGWAVVDECSRMGGLTGDVFILRYDYCCIPCGGRHNNYYVAPACTHDPKPTPPCRCAGDECGEETMCSSPLFESGTNSPKKKSCPAGCTGSNSPTDGDPINVLEGEQVITRMDLQLDAGTWILDIAPQYNDAYKAHTNLGFGWHSVLNMRLFRKSDGGFVVRDQHGYEQEYYGASDAIQYPAKFAMEDVNGNGIPLEVLSEQGPFIYSSDHKSYFFGADGALDSIVDGGGFGFEFQYDLDSLGMKILQPVVGISTTAQPANNRSIVVRDFRVNTIRNLGGNLQPTQLSYDSSGYLETLIDPAGRRTEYTYDHDSILKIGRLTSIRGTKGLYFYEYNNPVYIRKPIQWNEAPIADSLVENLTDASSWVSITRNFLNQNGRIDSQYVGEEVYKWKLVKNVGKQIRTADRLWICQTKKTIVQRANNEIGKTSTNEFLHDTLATCNRITPIPLLPNEMGIHGVSNPNKKTYGKQWTSTQSNGSDTIRRVIYGDGVTSTPFVKERKFPNKSQSFSRNEFGQPVEEKEISVTGDADTIITRKAFDLQGHVVKETKIKRFALVANQVFNDSTVISRDYDAQGRLVQEVRWNDAADSLHGVQILQAFTYHQDGTIATETTSDGDVVQYYYTGSGFPGKPSRKVWNGLITRLYEWDALGRLSKETDPRGGETLHYYSYSGKDSLTIEPSGARTTQFWDGELLKRRISNQTASDPGLITIWKYNKDYLDTAEYHVLPLAGGGFDTVLVKRQKRDAFGRVLEEGDALDTARVVNVYNRQGYKIQEKNLVQETTYQTKNFSYDAMGRLIQEVLANGDEIRYELDGWGNRVVTRSLIRVGASLVQTQASKSVYNHQQQEIVRLDSLNGGEWHHTQMEYDHHGQLVRRIGSQADTTRMGYKNGGLLWQLSPLGQWVWKEKDSRGFDSLDVRLAVGHLPDTVNQSYALQAGDLVVRYSFDHSGNLRKTWRGTWQTGGSIDDLIQIRETTYYPSNRIWSDTLWVDSAGTHKMGSIYQWKSDGSLLSVSGSGGKISHWIYDSEGRRLSEVVQNDSGGFDTVQTNIYAENGWLMAQRTPGMGAVMRTYDGSGHVIGITDSSGVHTGLLLDELGRVIADTNGLNFVSRKAYGPNADTLWDRNSKKTIMTRDPLGRVVSITDHDGNQTLFFYTYDDVNNQQRDSVFYADSSWEVTVKDVSGHVVEKTDQRGVHATYAYADDWGIDSVIYRKGTTDSLVIKYQRDALGRTQSIERKENGTRVAFTEYTYDLTGRVLTQTQTLGTGIAQTTSYVYDDENRKVTMTLPDGSVVARQMDKRNRLDSISLDGDFIVSHTYNGNLQTGLFYGNGLRASLNYGVSGKSLGKRWTDSLGSLVVGDSLEWDLAGRLRTSSRLDAESFSETYGLDREGQLTSWNQATKILDWTLDARGNWTSVSEDSTETDTRIHSAMNEILTRNGTAFTYDGIGNLLTDDKGRTLTWTADGLLKSVVNADGSSATLTYDGQRRLVKMVDKNVSGITTNSVEYLWNGWQLAQEVRNGAETRTYVYGNYIDDAVAVKVTGGLTPGSYYYHRGINYTTQVITNASGGIVEGYKSKPYGEYSVVLPGSDGKLGTADDVEQSTSSINNANVFQGLPISAAGLVYARNRWMSPELGRWVSRDPIRYMASDPNLYRFVGNRAYRAVDPLGLLTASEGLAHYLEGSGSELAMDLSELHIENANAEWWKIPFGPKPKSNSCCKERKESYSNSKAYVIDKNKYMDQWALLGNITLVIDGTRKISRDCSCSFEGEISAKKDLYNFNASTHREWYAELITSYGRMLGDLWNGKPYYISFYGSKQVSFKCKANQ